MKIKFLLPALLLPLFFSCKKNKNEEYKCGNFMQCGDIQCFAFHSIFNMRLIDKSTGQNLLFGANPSLSGSDIKFYYNSTTQFPINKYIDTLNHTVNLFGAKEIMGLQLKNDPVKSINIKTFCEDGCCSRTAVEILYDGVLLIADDKKIFTIKL